MAGDNISNGMSLTSEEIKQSSMNKHNKPRGINQLPVFRNAVLLLNYVVDIAMKTPRSARRYTDSSIEITNDLLKAIGLANENRGQERVLCITDAVVLVYTLKAHLGIYYKRNIISKDAHNKSKKLCDNTVAQLIGWRDSVIREGYNSEN